MSKHVAAQFVRTIMMRRLFVCLFVCLGFDVDVGVVGVLVWFAVVIAWFAVVKGEIEAACRVQRFS